MFSSAIQRGAPGTFVYVMTPDHAVAVHKVKIGPSDGRRIAILSGLQLGENVVVVTVPSCANVTGTSPFTTGATLTGIAEPSVGRLLFFGWVSDLAKYQTAALTMATISNSQSNRRGRKRRRLWAIGFPGEIG